MRSLESHPRHSETDQRCAGFFLFFNNRNGEVLDKYFEATPKKYWMISSRKNELQGHSEGYRPEHYCKDFSEYAIECTSKCYVLR